MTRSVVTIALNSGAFDALLFRGEGKAAGTFCVA
jgi:hypothetical protein